MKNLFLCRDLIKLERGKEELLLVNSRNFNPLYFPSGQKYIKAFLKNFETSSRENLQKSFPDAEKLLNLLIFHNIIIQTEEKETEDENMVYSEEKLSGITLYLLISQSCNMGCIYCLDGKKTYGQEQEIMMPEGVALNAIENCLNNIKRKGRLEIVFFGGEPLLNWELVKKIIIKCEQAFKKIYRDIKFHYHITSNLTLLPYDLVEWAKKYKFTFLCDIDGPEELHNMLRPMQDGTGSYDITVKNIKTLCKNNLKINLRTTVTSHNQNYMTEIALLHKDLGAASTAFVNLNPVNSDEEILPDTWYPDPFEYLKGLINIIDRGIWKIEDIFPVNDFYKRMITGKKLLRACGAPYGRTITVDVKGNIFPCIYWVGINSLKIGNIFDKTLYSSSPVLKNLMKKLHIDYTERCKKCSWRYICAGGCPVHKISIMENQKASKIAIKYANSINCITAKGLLEHLLWKKAEEAFRESEI